MKKQYEKPMLVRRENLVHAAATAQNGVWQRQEQLLFAHLAADIAKLIASRRPGRA